jgi:hypothetical protein
MPIKITEVAVTKHEKKEVFTYRLINGDSMTGIVDKVAWYETERVVADRTVTHTSVITEYVTPCVFHSDQEGNLLEVTTNVVEFPPVQLFMRHVAGIASQGFHDVKELSTSEADEAANGDDDATVASIRSAD